MLDQITNSTPLALAKACVEWYPEFGGRCIAVADCKINRERMPILPLIMVMFAGETARTTVHSTQPPKITEKIIVEFWRKPELYKLANGGESPFYAYVDYRADRDVLIHNITQEPWTTPDGSLLTYQGISITSDEYAYTVEMHLTSEYVWQDYLEQPVPKIDKDSIGFCIHG